MVFLAWVGFMSGLSGCQLVSSDGYGAQCDFTGFYRVLPTTIGLIPSTIIYWVSLYWMVRPLAPHLFRSRSLRCGLGFTGFNRGRAGFIGVVFFGVVSFDTDALPSTMTHSAANRRCRKRLCIGPLRLCLWSHTRMGLWFHRMPIVLLFFLNQVSYSVKL